MSPYANLRRMLSDRPGNFGPDLASPRFETIAYK
jgi:hypothetical protein